MVERKPKDIASLLYLAHALPTLHRQSDEAARFVEAAILECVMTMAAAKAAEREPAEIAWYLRHALDEVAAISPTAAALLDRATRSLRDDDREIPTEPSVVH